MRSHLYVRTALSLAIVQLIHLLTAYAAHHLFVIDVALRKLQVFMWIQPFVYLEWSTYPVEWVDIGLLFISFHKVPSCCSGFQKTPPTISGSSTWQSEIWLIISTRGKLSYLTKIPTHFMILKTVTGFYLEEFLSWYSYEHSSPHEMVAIFWW